MSVTYQFDQSANELHIQVKNTFNFSLVGEFRAIYTQIEKPAKIVIDLHETDMIDSSGLGILLYLQKHFGSSRDNTFLINCNATIIKTLTMAKFGKMFTIEPK